jgi:hypothetical protein
MARFFLLSASLLLVLSPCVRADEDDPIQRDLDKARAAHKEALQAAHKKLLAALEMLVDKAANAGDLQGLKKLTAEKEAFEKNETLPEASATLVARKRYDADRKEAVDALVKELERAKKAFIKAKNIEKAEAVDKEIETIRPTPPQTLLVGEWSKAGETISFTADGKFTCSRENKAPVPGLYRFEGDNLVVVTRVLNFHVPNGPIKITKEKLIVTVPNGFGGASEETYTRSK